ncbi:DUF4174 domain-containing protein [Hymenobacter pini]|uniref:DUF4174 domain-containing protein n=1 Tax=Hymenobacter pini TaxID=2880879 RepID=UPI001CF1E4E7|nr:DUF4174 domain-containing protein [Hymenobacter pini]MCA8831367.1 DUF4174 domain-containing protein [Hymenobacter pini]
MKAVRYFLLVLALGCAYAAQAQTSTSLAATLRASKWQKRVLLLCAPTPDDADLVRQRQLLGPVRGQLNSRDLLVREIIFSQLSTTDTRYLWEQLNVQPGRFAVLLIGKDGGVKRRETTPLPTAQLFSTIDAMPMRQQEMRRAEQ